MSRLLSRADWRCFKGNFMKGSYCIIVEGVFHQKENMWGSGLVRECKVSHINLVEVKDPEF